MTNAPTLQVNELLTQLSTYALLKNEARRNEIKARGQTLFDFGIGDPLEETPEFIRKALIEAIPKVSQYPLSQGAQGFRSACADWVKRRFAVDLNEATQVLSSNGSKEAIFHAPQILLSANAARRIVLAPDPGFPVYKSGTVLAGGVCYEIALDPAKNYVFDPEAVPKELLSQIAAVWVSYPHNPTGAQLPRQQARKIYEWAVAHNIVVFSDECYVDMYFSGSEPPCSFLEISKDRQFQNVLSFFSLSKRSGMTGYRSGFVAGDERLVGAFKKLRPHIGLATPQFIQEAAKVAWADDSHVLQRNEIFKSKRRVADVFLAKYGFDFVPSDSTFYVWIQVPKAFAEIAQPVKGHLTNWQDPKTKADFTSGELYCQALAKNCGIVASPGDALGQSCDDFFRLALVPTQSQLIDALAVWEKWIQSGHSV